MLEIEGIYYATFGRAITQNIRNQIRYMIEYMNAQPEMISAIIEYAGDAPHPSWSYARTVISRKINEGILTADAWNKSLIDWHEKQAKRFNACKETHKVSVWRSPDLEDDLPY